MIIGIVSNKSTKQNLTPAYYEYYKYTSIVYPKKDKLTLLTSILFAKR